MVGPVCCSATGYAQSGFLLAARQWLQAVGWPPPCSRYICYACLMPCAWHRDFELHVYVDDVVLNAAHRRPDVAADRLSQAAKLLLKVFKKTLHLQIAFQKCVLLAASSNVDGRLRANLQHTV